MTSKYMALLFVALWMALIVVGFNYHVAWGIVATATPIALLALISG